MAAATLTFCVFVCPFNTTAFKACDAVNAYDELAIVDVELDTNELNHDSSNLPVPTTAPLTYNDPVIFTDPVKL